MTSRQSSLPPLGVDSDDEVVHSVLNPAYSGSTVAASEDARSSRQRPEALLIMEEGEVDKRPPMTPAMRRMRCLVILLLLLIGLLIAPNAYHWLTPASSPPTTETPPSSNVTLSDLELLRSGVLGEILSSDIASDQEEASPTTSTTTTTEAPTTTEATTTTTTSTTTPPPTIAPRERRRADYERFTERFNRSSSERGLDAFVENMECLNEAAADSVGTAFGWTAFADMSEPELRKLLTPARDEKRTDVSRRCDVHAYARAEHQENTISGSSLYDEGDRIPSRVDLRRRGVLGAVKDQGTTCAAGYAFAVASLLESKVVSEPLSAQQLLADEFNHHCEGGETFRAMQSVEAEGLVEESVLPFDELQLWRHIHPNATTFKHESACVIASSQYTYREPYHGWGSPPHVEPGPHVPAALYIRHFLAKVGTVLVEVPVDRSFFFYKSGLYSADCSNILGYQPAVVIGYGMRAGKSHWILRNSFGTEWGSQGDFELSMENNCDAFEYAFTFHALTQ